ncbi:MAG: segregation/condensation protein A [Sporomusaceae bacterium]|jgi:segregation and condensation protein A|nr:segregation/condensation protein A [Sporomusaceae bacterium]
MAKESLKKTGKQELNIKLEVFEGPLELLMHLIEKNKIDIYDIQIALITEQYLAYLNAMQQFDLEIASEFLLMAATLIQIKSRLLLPRQLEEEEEEEEDDPLKELTERLLLYREFKQASLYLGQMAKLREQSYTRYPQATDTPVTLPQGLTLNELVAAFAGLLEAAGDEYALIEREEISVNDKMRDILLLLHTNEGVLEFGKVIFRQGGKHEIIVSFLAVLELIRLQKIIAAQDGGFAPIFLRLNHKNREQE